MPEILRRHRGGVVGAQQQHGATGPHEHELLRLLVVHLCNRFGLGVGEGTSGEGTSGEGTFGEGTFGEGMFCQGTRVVPFRAATCIATRTEG